MTVKLIAVVVLALFVCGCALLEKAANGSGTTDSPGRRLMPMSSTERFEFSPDPYPPGPGSGVLTYVNGASTAFMVMEPGAGPHQRAESVIFEFESGRAGGWVEYVDKSAIVDCLTGAVVPVRGEAVLKVHFGGASQHDAKDPEYLPKHIPGDGHSIAESKLICDSGGVVEWVIGTRGVRNFTVDLWDDPRRVSVNVLR
jgi:hypothetical protein